MAASGALVARQTREAYAYGAPRTSDGTLPTDYTFTGQKVDASAGLMYYGARYYDAALGRFTQADTIVPDWYNPQDLNRYTYVRNNPIIRTDPTGHFPPVIAAVAGFATSPAGLLVISGAAVITYESYQLGWGPKAAQNRQALVNVLEVLEENILAAKKYDGTPKPVGRPQSPPPLPIEGAPLDSDVPIIGGLPPGPVRDFAYLIAGAYTIARIFTQFQTSAELGDAPYTAPPPKPPSRMPTDPCGNVSTCIRAPDPDVKVRPTLDFGIYLDDPRLFPVPY